MSMPSISYQQNQNHHHHHHNSATNATSSSSSSSATERGPAAAWQCDFEVSNLSWSPSVGNGGNSRDWLGVCGGRGIWGISL